MSTSSLNNKKVIKFSYKWTIRNFQSEFDSLESPIFSKETHDNIRWHLQIKTKNVTRSHSYGSYYEMVTNLYVTLVLISDDEYECKRMRMQSHCKFQLLSAIPEYTRTWNQVFQIPSDDKNHDLNCFDIRKDEILNTEKKFLNDGNVIITCEIIAVVSISMPLHTIPNCTWQNDLDSIFENRKFTDVTFCASGKEYHVHRVILAARSPVFNAMFEHEMAEKKQGRVEITDIDDEALGELLRFIYTGKVLNIKNFAFDLVPAAEKYQLKNLKMLCENKLCSNISVENAADVLVLADIYNLDQLKAVAISFIGSHFVDIAKTSGWQSMLKSHVDLFMEVLCDLVQERNFLLSLH